MKLVFRITFRFIPLAGIVWLILSCKPDINHEIITQETSYVLIKLDSKEEPEVLKELAWYYYEEHKDESGAFHADFCIPSEYPDYPETPWAMINIIKEQDKPVMQLRIFGTRTNEDKEKLIERSSQLNNLSGKWYFNEPILESVYCLVENQQDTLMLIYKNPTYEEYDNEVFEPMTPFTQEPDFSDQLSASEKKNVYFFENTTTPSYQISSDGKLILLQRIKSYKDTTQPVLEALPF